MKILDITRPLIDGIAVWPGDERFRATFSAEIGSESTVNVGAVSMSLHTGTHVDAPRHYRREGKAVDELDLTAFVGPAMVVEILTREAIQPYHLERLERLELGDAQRVLFKTSASHARPDGWYTDFPALAPATIDFLADRGVVLIGVDGASVDPVESKTLAAHHRLAERGIVNIEGLWLPHVAPGHYRLIALPLPITGMDASPVRAVLVLE